jgi:hypothetical protein
VNDEQGGSGHGVRVFAGPRWDPFIMDARAALTTIATGRLSFTADSLGRRNADRFSLPVRSP